MPQTTTLAYALEVSEQAVYASSLFVIVVQDRFEVGGGFGVNVLALNHHFHRSYETLEEVETFLATETPYLKYAAHWIPLPHHFRHDETALFLQLKDKSETTQKGVL